MTTIRQKRPRVSSRVRKRRHQVSELLLKRWRQCDIAEKLGVTDQVVSKDAKAIHEDWKASLPTDVSEFQRQDLKALAQMEQQACEQYDKTRKVHWLRVRLDIMARRAKIVGMDQPLQLAVRIDHSWLSKPVAEMTDSELQQAIKEAEQNVIDV